MNKLGDIKKEGNIIYILTSITETLYPKNKLEKHLQMEAKTIRKEIWENKSQFDKKDIMEKVIAPAIY